METKNKYATMSVGERLDRIRHGDTGIYEEELKRANDAIRNLEELGLDTGEQNEWIKKLRYVKTNNNGIGSQVTPEEYDYLKSTGQSIQLIFAADGRDKIIEQLNRQEALKGGGGGGGGQGPGTYAVTPDPYQVMMNGRYAKHRDAIADLETELKNRSEANDAYYDEQNRLIASSGAANKNDYYLGMMKKLPAMYEKFANTGISFDGGRAKSEELVQSAALAKTLSAIDADVMSNVNSNNIARKNERSKAYTDYLDRLTAENDRLDEFEYQITRDRQAADEKAQQLAFDKYKYDSNLAMEKEAKTAEQKRWEKEFGLKLDSQDFDKLVRQNEMLLDSDKFAFDRTKYDKEYNLRLDQFAADRSDADRQYNLSADKLAADKASDERAYNLSVDKYNTDRANAAKELELKFNNAEFNRQLDTLRYNLDADKAAKDYELKKQQNAQEMQKYVTDTNLKKAQQQTDYEKFLKDYALEQQKLEQAGKADAAALGQRKAEEAQEYAKWQREQSLKEYIAQSNLNEAQKEYALKYYEATKDGKNLSGSETSAPATTYDDALATGIWMKTQYSGKTRTYTDSEIDKWVDSISKLSKDEKTKLRETLKLSIPKY